MVHAARPSGGGGAGQGDEAGLGPAVELELPGRSLLRLADQGGLEALLDEPLADPLDGGGADLQGLGDLPVGPGGAAVGGVGLEQDAGMGQLAGGGLDRRRSGRAGAGVPRRRA